MKYNNLLRHTDRFKNPGKLTKRNPADFPTPTLGTLGVKEVKRASQRKGLSGTRNNDPAPTKATWYVAPTAVVDKVQ